MDGTAEEQRMRKVQAGRDKLARFRQHKTKGQSSKAQKKTQKRKGEVVHTNDIPPEENTLTTAEYADKGPLLGVEQISVETPLDHSSLNVSEHLNTMSDLEYRLQEKQDDAEIQVEDISQFETTVEAGSSELHETTKEKENQMATLENLLHEQQKRLETLQEKLDLSESSVSHLQQELSGRNQEVLDLKHRISMTIQTNSTPSCSGDDKGGGKIQRLFDSGEDGVELLSQLVMDLKEKLSESDCLRESLVKKIEKQMKDFETERHSWEQRHNDDVSSLKEKLKQAEQTAAQDKDDKDRLNKEICDLKESLKLETESSEALKLQQEKDLQTCVLKLHNMEEDKAMLCQKLSSNKQEGSDMDEEIRQLLNDSKDDHFRHELEDIKKNLSRVKARKEHENSKMALLHKEDYDLVPFNESLTSMDKYLLPNQSELLEMSYGQDDTGERSRFELDSDFMLEQSVGSTIESNFHLLCSPMPITGVLSGAASLGAVLDPESFAIYLSSNLASSDEKTELSPDFAENAFQKCSVLMDQLKEKEKQLQMCSVSLEEAITKWREVTAELAATKLELDRERTNRNSEEQQRLIEALKERDEFKLMLSQGQHLKETPNQQLAKDEQLSQLLDKNVFLENKIAVIEKELERAMDLNKNLQVSNVNLAQNLHDSEMARESEQQDFDNKLNSKGLEQQLLQEAIKAKEEEFFGKEESLREEVHLLEQMKKDIQSRLQEQLVHNVDLDALRLSLTNMHAAQLELNQSNLLKEKENALVQLRETLTEKRAQELALLQSRHQFELQRLQDEVVELKNLNDKLSQEIMKQQEEHLRMIEQLRVENTKALVEQQKCSFEMERLKELHGNEKEEWKIQQDLRFQDMKDLQDQHVQKIEQLQVLTQDMNLLKEHHAKEGLDLNELKDLQAQYVQQEKEWEIQQDKHSKEIKLLNEEQLQDTLIQKELHSKMIEQIKLEFSEEIKLLQEQHDTEKDLMKKLHAEEKLQWENQKNDYCQELERLQGELSEAAFQKSENHSEQIALWKEKHLAEVMQLQEQHNQETKMIKEDYATEKQVWEDQKQQLSQELKQVGENFSQKTLQQNGLHQEEFEKLQQKYSDEILQVQELHNKEKDQLLNTHLQEKRFWESKQEEWSKELLQLKEQYKAIEQLHNALVHEKEDLNKDRADQSEVIKRLQEDISLKILQLQEQNPKAIDELQDQHRIAMKELKGRHHRERDEWEKERDQCSQELDLLVNQHSQELKRIGEELLQVSLQKEEQNSKMLEQIQDEYSKTILGIQNQHSREMQEIVELHAKEKDQWESKNSQCFQKTQGMSGKHENPEEPKLIPETFEDLRRLKEQHDKAVKTLLECHELEKMEWKNELEHLSKQLNHLVTHNFQEIKKYMDEHSEEIEEHSAKILQIQEHYQKEIETLYKRYAQKNLKLKDDDQALGDVLHQPHDFALLDQNADLGQQIHIQVASLHLIPKKLQIQSSQEMQVLWSQIDSSRASRQELHELKEQLIARSLHLEEIERMKQEFHKQQQQLNAAHEKDMEDLRIYFEEKSRAAEESYRENLELLHQRMREMSYEGKDEIITLNSSVLTLDESFESERSDLLLHLTEQLVQHKEESSSIQQQSQEKHKQEIENLHVALSHQYQEDLLSMKTDLCDKHTYEIETLKTRHCLELEQLRAKLSEEHIMEMARMHQGSSEDAECHERTETLGKLSAMEEPKYTEVKIMELSSIAGDKVLKHSGKVDKICQTDTTLGTLVERLSEEKSKTSFGEAEEQVLILHEQNALELESIKDQMASELKELVKKLYAEKARVLKALKEAQHRTKQFHEEKKTIRGNLLGDQQTSLVSKGKPSELISILLTQEEDLNSLILEERHRWEPGTCVSELQENISTLHHHLDGDIYFQTADLERYPEQNLLSCLSELLQRHQEELQSRDLEHEAHIQGIEASQLIKLDTLESSYLTEIQKIRDEHSLALEELEVCLSHRLQEKEREIQERLEKDRMLWLQQQEQELQHLRQELASVHLEKFQAMSKELEIAHQDDLKDELDQQRLQLEYDKNQALDALREEVLRMEDHNKLAFKELSDLQKIEVQQQTQTLQDELMKLAGERQKQELVITELNNQLQALSTELENKSNQLFQLQEEIELLKCQSEMLLEQQIAQLKEELITEKKSAMQEIEEQFTRDSEKLHDELNKEKELLMRQLEEKNGLVLQLQEKVSLLTNEMEEVQSQTEAIVQTRERENQEGKNLETILHSEVQIARQEQGKLQDSCQRLLKIFTDVLKNTLVTEDLIFKKIGLCLDSTLSEDRNRDALTKSTVAVSEKHCPSPDCDILTEHSLMSTDEGYDVSEYLCDSVLGSLEVGLENEEKIVQMSQRLRSAVGRLLDMVSNSSLQLEQTRDIHKSFEEEFKSRNQEMAQVVVKNQDLVKLLAQESETKNQLEVELHKAQGLIEGYAAEKAALEETLSLKETSEHQLVVELEKSREQLKVLTQEPAVLWEEKELLLRLQEVLSSSEKDVEVELLKETQRLIKEKLELHCQADKDRSNLLSHMRVLEMELEDQMARNQELLKKRSEMTDLEQQIQALEKQLKHQRQFMDEQAVEREHERDDFQQEIRNLEEQLKQALKNNGDSRTHRLHDWSEQNEARETNAKDKANLNLLIEGKDHLEQQIAERNEEIDKMLVRIQELEQAALSNADAAKNCSKLEAELKNMHTIQKELLQDKDALQQQQYNNVLQISALQSKLDETRHRLPVEGEPDGLLKKELQAEREALQRKEKEAESLAEQLELFREELTNKTEEVLQLNMQLEIQRKQSEQAAQQAQEEYLQLKEEMSSLHLERTHDKSSSSLELLQALLQEKNQEIDHLNEQLLRLQEETSDVEELRSLVEHLRSDQERLRKDKEEEMEQLHEVIEKLQQELEQLGPIRHEVSDSQESLDQLGLGGADNLQAELRKGTRPLERARVEKERLEETESLCITELEALQQQLEEKEVLHVAETEVLETDLQNLQQSLKQKEQALAFVQLEHRNLQEEIELLRTRVSQREESIAVLTAHLQRLQDAVREKDAILVEKDLEVQTLQEQNMGDMSMLRNQLAQSVQALEATKIDLQKVQEQNVSLQTNLTQSSKEQSKRERTYKEELEQLRQCLKEWKETSHKLMEEVQTQTDGNQNMNTLEAESHFAVLNEQVNAAERLASEQEAKLSIENKLNALNNFVDELRTECESWKAEAQHLQQQLKKKEACVAEVHSHSLNLGAQVKKLQEALVSQEAMISVISVDLQKQIAEDQVKTNGSLRSDVKHRSFSESLTDLSAWDSPDMVRKQEEQVHSLRGLTPFSELSINHSAELEVMKSKSSGCVKQLEQYNLLGSSTPSLSDSVYSLQHSIHTQRTSPVRETGHPSTDYDSCDDQPSSEDHHTETEQSDELDYKLEAARFQFDEVENLFDVKQKMDSMSGSGLSAQLQKMLSMVHEESCQILELSERPVAKVPSPESTALQFQRDAWLKERENLQETIQSLSTALAQPAGKGSQESSTSDWRRDLLQSVQALLESEREYLRLELQSQLHHSTGEKSSLSEGVEHLIKEQEEQKRLILEHVLAMDRSSLLSEIQDLRAQIRMAHLQNQEKLQQLQDALTSSEEKGHTKDHQLRKQVELYQYKLQQEAAIAEDLKGSLLREQERSTEQHKQLLQEQSTVSQLRSELEELQLALEKLRRQQKEMQIEASKLRNELKSKEEATSVLMHTVQTQREVESQRFEEEQNLIQQKVAHKERSLQESYLSLEEQKKLNAKISAALLQEQTYTSNLRKELEIEQSRCQALLAQEHKKLSETEIELEKEKQYSLSLSSALTLERNVVEQLRQLQSQELCRQEEERHQEHKIVVTLQNQLEEERRCARDLATMMEKTQKQAVDAKRQLESEIQACREEMQKEREAAVKLRAHLEALQSQKQQLDSVLEQQKERETHLQNEREQYQAQLLILREEERLWAKEREKGMGRSKQTELTRARAEEQERQIMGLQLQHERDKRRIQELQHMLADLEEQERALASRKSQTWTDIASPAKNLASLTSQMQRVWQQLLHIVLKVKKWMPKKSDCAHQGYPTEAEVTALLDSLAELKLELQRGNLQTSVPSPSIVVDVLKRENAELTTTVSQLTKEKLELRSQLTKLSRSLQESPYKEKKEQLHSDSLESVLEAERAVWNREKRLLQIALKNAESELGKATIENRPLSDVPNSKMQRLYKKYLRAESFRKALVYQKKYLLLLLGGFQACEKATLSLIARMGVYPSPGDLQYPAKSPSGLTKFRSAVRAVIAISRLKFLVRKWNKNSRKGVVVEPAVQQVQTNRTDVLQHLSGTLLNSPPTRDLAYGHNHSSSFIGTPSPKPLPWASRRIGHSPALTPETSPYTPRDPEHSITEYIHHLEMVQRRLGGLQNGHSPELPRVKYARK